jgi:exopolysaccharide biosynthesis polyprenyl glycosylphosphotransferase
MSSFRRKLLLKLLKLSDICILISSVVIASWFVTYKRDFITLEEFFSLRIKVVNFIGFIAMILSWHLLFNSFQLYRSRRLDYRFGEWKDILKATTTGSFMFLMAGLLFNIIAFTPLFIGIFWLSSSIFTITFRTFLRIALKKVRLYGRNLRFVLIIGTNKRAYDFARMIEEKKELGYRLRGYVDKNIYFPKEGLRLLGTLEDFPTIIKDHVIDEVVIALPVKSHYEEIQKIVQKAEEQGIIIRYLSQLFDTKIAQSKAEKFEDFAVVTMSSGPQDDWQYLAKRTIDIILASVLTILTSPLMIFAAIAIKITSSGPILFVQDRIGYNKRIFRLYKFRTMVVGAEKLQRELEDLNEMDGPVFKIRNDPRITKIGRWLRKTSIDELPQLFNVLKGDMSLVGPRPLPVRDYSGFDQDWQRRRFSVLPGITCIWQINGRNEVSFGNWMKMDMEYIDNWSLSTDLKILLKTIPAVIKGRGAT